MVGRKKDLKHMESRWPVDQCARRTAAFSAAEQKRIVDCVHDFREKGRNRQLREACNDTIWLLLQPCSGSSVLILNGNGADAAKHCVPAVPSERSPRISITFRKMDDGKFPYKFSPDPELQNLHPLSYPPRKSPVQQVANQRSPNQQQITPQARVLGKDMHDHQSHNLNGQEQGEIAGRASSSPFNLGSDDFPPPGSSNDSIGPS
ncbi:hypothetical protein COCNU_08G011700 [Cocos nucifera]|uniref:Uncharacterized protein n=1 Tax=Cocos nucifera TaxID=13894 RepID=A0A8K0IIF7_COCNU|nr:hypothetical protein COCNU_08G011700 [Cocos nucifera]